MTEHAAWSRRAFLPWAGGGALTAAAAGWSPSRAWGGRPVDGDPFALGVASGDPAPDGVVLWTRLAPKPLDPPGGMPARKVPVRWEIAADERFRRTVHLGDAIYEDGPSDDGPRRHDGTDEPITVDEYRRRHALYRTDSDLQLVCGAHPFIVTFDDHEVDNDWGGDVPQDPDQQSPRA
jgi:phosphodiesterase/alkaline phosphatase D-like protein